MNTERLSETFIELCRIPSPTGHEAAVATLIRRCVAGLGLALEEDDAGAALAGDCGNLIVHGPPAAGEPLYLTAHMDTVPVPPAGVPVVVDGDRVHTGGRSPLGGDDKSGIALALDLLAEAVANPGRFPPLDVIFTVQEERQANGARLLDPGRVAARQGFILDGETPVGSIIRGAPYKLGFEVTVSGRRAHAAIEPEQGVNAVKALGAIVASLPTGRINPTTVANLAAIAGGGPTNIVPDRATLSGEMRSLDEKTLRATLHQFEEISRREASRLSAAAELTWEMAYPGYFVPDDAACVQRFVRACRDAGYEPALLTSLGGGDANRLNGMGLTGVVFGIGMESIHSPDEWMSLARLAEAARLLERTVGGVDTI